MGIIKLQNEFDAGLIDVQNRAEGRPNHSGPKWIHYDDQHDTLLYCNADRKAAGEGGVD